MKNFPAFTIIDEMKRSCGSLSRLTVDLSNSQLYSFAEVIKKQKIIFEELFSQVPVFEYNNKLQEKITFLDSVGILPHPVVASIVEQPDEFVLENTELWIENSWSLLSERLALDVDETLNDEKINIHYRHMIDSHSQGFYPMVSAMMPSLLDRIVNKAEPRGELKKTFEFMKSSIGELPISKLGGGLGVQFWLILTRELFSNCYEDKKADQLKYPNRHVVAHGLGSKIDNSIDSLNAILIVNFFIKAINTLNIYQKA